MHRGRAGPADRSGLIGPDYVKRAGRKRLADPKSNITRLTDVAAAITFGLLQCNKQAS